MRQLGYFLVCFVLITSCVKNNPLPTYLELNKWNLIKNTDPEANPSGELTHDFSDAWVYVDNKLIGIFELPCKVPVLQQGKDLEVLIYPAIRNNGVSDQKQQYPFCDPFKTTQDFNPGETVQLNLTTKYSTSARFWFEDFEDPSLKLINDQNGQALMARENNPEHQLNGGFYGHVELNAKDTAWRAYSNEKFVLPKGREIYLEVNYKTDLNFLSGIVAYTNTASGIPYIYLNNNGIPVWKKIYIQLKQPVSEQINASVFDLFFQAQQLSGSTTKNIYLDNIKLVY